MTTRAGRVVAQAKINLMLRVLAREASGYHQIETIFARIDLGDTVSVRTGSVQRSLRCDGPAASAAAVGPVEANLAWRAAEAFAAATGFPRGFEIEIDKHIPVGAGLGGGSADAGAVLRILNALAPSPLPQDDLLVLAAALGADVPFLTIEAPYALAWGRGERMALLEPLAPREVVLVFPGFSVPTAEAFSWVSESLSWRVVQPVAIEPDVLRSWAGVTALAGNDFELPVALRHPLVAELPTLLLAAGARIAQLSGSGSTVFGVFDAPPDRGTLEASLPCPLAYTRTATRVVAVEVLE